MIWCFSVSWSSSSAELQAAKNNKDALLLLLSVRRSPCCFPACMWMCVLTVIVVSTETCLLSTAGRTHSWSTLSHISTMQTQTQSRGLTFKVSRHLVWPLRASAHLTFCCLKILLPSTERAKRSCTKKIFKGWRLSGECLKCGSWVLFSFSSQIPDKQPNHCTQIQRMT